MYRVLSVRLQRHAFSSFRPLTVVVTRVQCSRCLSWTQHCHKRSRYINIRDVITSRYPRDLASLIILPPNGTKTIGKVHHCAVVQRCACTRTLCMPDTMEHSRRVWAILSRFPFFFALPFSSSLSTESQYNVLWRRSAVEVWSVDRARQKRRAAKIKGPIEAAW